MIFRALINLGVVASAAIAGAAVARGTFHPRLISWAFIKDGMKVWETIDAHGNYVARTKAKELDHGRVLSKGGKACFTSAVDKNGETCWTARSLRVGQSMISISDKGEKLKVTRVRYTPMKAYK